MDSSLPIIQGAELDTVMRANDISHAVNGNLLSNGFMDPRDLTIHSHEEHGDTQDSMLESSSDSTPPQTSPQPPRRKAYLPTGCYYDDRMKFHANADYSEDSHHPEDPRRIEYIMKALRNAGLVYTGGESDLRIMLIESPTKYLWRIPARNATENEICLAHTKPHFQWVKDLSSKSTDELRVMSASMDSNRKSLYVSGLTYQAALLSAGGAIETCKRVVLGELKNGIAVIRPPGHHAEFNEPMGFCLFNNVPIAAKVCMQDHPELCRKVLILDWDVHHGNGIQNIFYDDPNVLYISIHVYKDSNGGHFYPGKPEDETIPDGGIPNVGGGVGIGRNINIGWHSQGMGDAEYMAAFQKLVMPIGYEFNPDLVIISAGFDAAKGDDLGGCFVSPECYSHMTHMLMSLAGGKLAVCLEGGYNLAAISESALAVTQTLMGEPPRRIKIPPLNHRAGKDLEMVRNYHSPYWNCLRPGVVKVEQLQSRNAERFSVVARIYEKSVLSKKHNMINMPIMRNTSRAFQNQVLATPQIHQAKRILLLIHDPPEIFAKPDSLRNIVESQNAWMTTDLANYIEWAVENGFGVIDVNIPKKIEDDDKAPMHDKAPEEDQAQLSRDLLGYLWDNHLQINQDAAIVVMGVGDAYLGIKQLVTSRDAKDRIPCILAYVTGTLRPVRSETDASLRSWYRKHSLLYVNPDHSCWTDEYNRNKVAKYKYGNVQKSVASGLGNMLQHYEDSSTKWVL
ncbi:hypothetical protein BJ875DRAFT_357559, partial [Amylocarpus encephaloides]